MIARSITKKSSKQIAKIDRPKKYPQAKAGDDGGVAFAPSGEPAGFGGAPAAGSSGGAGDEPPDGGGDGGDKKPEKVDEPDDADDEDDENEEEIDLDLRPPIITISLAPCLKRSQV